MIHVIATIEIAEGRRDDFLQEFHQIVEPVRAEDGCLEYGPTIDVPTDFPPKAECENVVTVVEKWESLDHLRAHLQAPHMLEYRQKVKEMVLGSKLQVLQPA